MSAESASSFRPSFESVTPVGRQLSHRSSRSSRLSLTNKSCSDLIQSTAAEVFGSESTDAHAVLLHGLKQKYPNLCFCENESKSGVCRGTGGKGHAGNLPFSRVVLWVTPFFGWYALKFLKVGWMKKFYIDDYPKASLGIVAMFSVLSTLVDAFTDPKMATVTDTFQSRYGRRRPFVVASAFFVPLITVLGWTPPGEQLVASIWYGIMHIGYKLADTLFLMPTEAWLAQLTPIYLERTMCWFWRDVMANMGILMGMAVAPVVFVSESCTSTPGSGCLQFPLIATFFGILFGLSCLLLALLGKEPPTCERERPDAENPKPRFSEDDPIPMLMSTLQHRPFRILLIADIAKAVGQELPFNVLPFMVTWVIGQKCYNADRLFSFLVLGNLLCGLLSMVFWRMIATRFNKFGAYVLYNVAVAITSLSFIASVEDSGDCVSTLTTLAITCVFGAAYGGSFLIKDLVSDAVDYDEFLAGGRRREAYYFMSIEFIPKFMNIPGECVPFLFMAYYNYTRPLKEENRLPCSGDLPGTSLSWDHFCDHHYRHEAPGSNLCSDTATCADLVKNGVTFVCNTYNQECGVRQNDQVVLLLRLCFSLVPFIVGCFALAALYFYPKEARSEKGHERLLSAIELQRQGHIVEDPIRPGHFVAPALASGPNTGMLSYFWTSELRSAIGSGSSLFIGNLLHRPCALAGLFALLLPAGGVLIVVGLEDMADDLGASVSPLGLMIAGLGLLGTWFHGTRCWAAWMLLSSSVTLEEVIARHDQLCAFTGEDRVVPLPVENVSQLGSLKIVRVSCEQRTQVRACSRPNQVPESSQTYKVSI